MNLFSNLYPIYYFNKVLRVIKAFVSKRISDFNLYIFYANSFVLFLNFSNSFLSDRPEFSLWFFIPSSSFFFPKKISYFNFSLFSFSPNFYILISHSSIKFLHICSLPVFRQNFLFSFSIFRSILFHLVLL